MSHDLQLIVVNATNMHTILRCVLLSLFHQFIVDSRDYFTIRLQGVFHYDSNHMVALVSVK